MNESNLNSLTLSEVPTPQPQAHEALIRLHASSLNYLDIIVSKSGFAFPGLDFLMIPVTDGAGEIVELGKDVKKFSIGDKVVPNLILDWIKGGLNPQTSQRLRGVNTPGSLAEYVAVPATSLAKIPNHLNYEEAAPCP